MQGKYQIIIVHTIAWIVYLLILVLGAPTHDTEFWVNTFCTLIPVFILFYTAISFLFPRYLPQRKFFFLAGYLVVFNFLAICLRLILVSWLKRTGFNNWIEGLFSPVMFWNQFRVNLLFIGISFAYWYARRNYIVEKDQQRLEREILNARLSSLKNQINPHFLHNTLSFLYTRSLPYSGELAGAIARLSDMMRYSLGEVGEDGKVSLKQEVNHLQNFIEIHQLRFDNKLAVDFHINGNYQQHRIMPLLLVTFVENAFKHGRLTDPEHPLHINLNTNDEQIVFAVKNQKANGIKQRSSGIGLQNVCSRLELAYPDQHEFRIIDNSQEFIINLKLKLNT
jgi:hypothetical protein